MAAEQGKEQQMSMITRIAKARGMTEDDRSIILFSVMQLTYAGRGLPLP